ncbi:MAG TPA: FAD-dependent oxidoreductase [Vicinamibacterales bacterium]|jgi:phytoene dehydrogenase-like protein|nr:FAD-dependent oxidoreductase [Vicinamibacterales bacterium]
MTTIVIGGGIAGLVAATSIANAHVPVVLLEKAPALGGRGSTHEKHGFSFNLGPHALYRAGVFSDTLRSLGIEPSGAVPGGDGGFAIHNGTLHTLPAGLTSLLTTSLFPLLAKFEFARLLSSIGSIDTSALQHETLEHWLSTHIRHERVRDVITMLVRVTTFTNAPDVQSAGAAIEQLQLATRANVLYVDGGWRTIIEGLRRAATAAGVEIRTAAPAVRLERRDSTAVAVRLADGTLLPAAAFVVTGGPSDVDGLTGSSFASTLPPAVRHATLDLALTSLPNLRRLVAFGVDQPLYFSVHSAVARLAPAGGALLHVSQYLRPGEVAGRDTERELEQLVDRLQPGWRDVLDTKQFLPNLTVTHTMLTAAQGGTAGRPTSRLAAYDNVFIAGDWVGPRGQLSDAAAGSALDAACAVLSRIAERPEAALAS